MTMDVVRRIDPGRLGSLALTAAVLGIVAGLVAALFATVAAEPAVDEAIAIEEAAAQADPMTAGDGADADGGHDDGADVSRDDQRGAGLFAAYALSGLAFGLLLALATHALRHGRPQVGHRVLVAGVILAGAITVAPWLKYPPNPPAVGDPDSLAQRQSLYVTVIVVTATVGIAGAVLARRLRELGWPDHRRVAAVVAAVAVPLLVVFAALPGAPDEIPVPASLVWRFRLGSLGANMTLWTVLTLALAWVTSEAAARRAPGGTTPVSEPETSSAG
jgi:predicted cobalt transporter CbtA